MPRSSAARSTVARSNPSTPRTRCRLPVSSGSSRSPRPRCPRGSSHWAASRSSPTTPGRRSRAASASRSSGITGQMPVTIALPTAPSSKQRPRSRARSCVTTDYFVPHLAHAQMEVPNAVAHWVGNTCETWSPTQNPTQVRQAVAQVLGINEANVTVNVTLLGGGFGRKSKPDYVAEAALLSRMVGGPVKVTWTREDDIQHDYYHAVCAQHLEAALDQDGHANAWLHRTVFPPIEATFQPDIVYGSGGELGQGVVDMPDDILNVRCENGAAANHVRIGWYRSVYNIPHAFAVCSFADELAVAAGKDPIAYLRQLLGDPRRLDFKAMDVDYPNYGASLDLYPVDTGRLRGVLDLVARNSEWGQPLPPRQGRGVAVHRSFLSYVAAIVQVAVAS